MRLHHTRLHRKAFSLPLALVALLTACSTPPPPPPAAKKVEPPIVTVPPPAVQPPRPVPPPMPAAVDKKISHARTASDYRKDAAAHLYEHNQERLYRGKLPPQLLAVGVLQVDIDNRGSVTGLNWIRAPRHAPTVMAEIERSVRQAAPFPLPARMGKVSYVDTWLWDSSGRFQLDTLSEGQL